MQCSQNKIVFTNALNITYTRFKVEMRHTSQWGPFFLVNSPSKCFIFSQFLLYLQVWVGIGMREKLKLLGFSCYM